MNAPLPITAINHSFLIDKSKRLVTDGQWEVEDFSHGMVRTEVPCTRCGSHLSQVFDDGPLPTGPRCCVNGVVLNFEPV